MRIVLSLLCAALLVPTAASSGTKARVWISAKQPLVVRGASFHPGERVKVTAVSKAGVVRRTVRASARGVLVARFGTTVKLGCNSVGITAIGSRGSRATAKIPGIECPPPGPVDPLE